MSTPSVRELGPAELLGAYRLGRLAFGGPAEPSARYVERVGRMRSFGIDAAGGGLAAVARVRDFAQFFGGREVPMAGLAGVAVAPEQRRRGLSRALLAGLLPVIRDAGQPVSALYPTVPEVYRRCGWEIAGAMSRTEVQTAHLAGLADDPTVTLRQAADADEPALLALYTAQAREGSGMLTRTGSQFPAGELMTADSTVLAERDGKPCGYYALNRPEQSGPDAVLAGREVVAEDPATLRTLLRSIGAYSPLVPRLDLVTMPGSALPLVCPAALETPGHEHPWMLRLIDAPAAVAARGWPPGVTVQVPLRLTDELAPWNAGDFRLVVTDGEARLEPRPASEQAVRLDGRGLAALYSGASRCAELRRAGLLTGPHRHDVELDAAFAGPVPAMIDYF